MKLPARQTPLLSLLPAAWGWRFFLFFLLLFPSPDYAQSLRSKHWSTDDGLSNNWVSDVLHDSRGFIWIATQWGVNKFDGHEFKLYRYNPNDVNSLNSNWVRSMAEDADGNLWFGMYPGGLARFNPFTEKFTHFVFDKKIKHSLPGNEVFKVFAGQGNRIWVSTSGGAAWVQAGDTVFHRVSEKPAYDLREDEQNRMWLAAEDGLFFWKNGKFETVLMLEGVPVYSISPVKNERERVWLFTERGLQLLENQAGKYKLSEPVLPADLNPNRWFFPPVLADSQGRIWAATSQGLFLDKEKNAFRSWRPTSPPALAQRLHSITEDRQGNIWLGTGKGVFLAMAGSEKIQAAAEMASLSRIPNVREVLRWKDEIWYATPQGLFFWKENRTEKILDASINALLLCTDGSIYAAPADSSPQGIFEIRPATKKSRFLPFPKTRKQDGTYRKVWSLAEDRHGNLWVGAQGSLYRSKPGTEVFQPFFAGENGDNDDIFIDLKIDPKGNLWAGTLKNGLYFIEHSHLADSSGNIKFRNYKHEPGNHNSLSNNTAEAVFASKNGKIWVGTDGGLNRLDFGFGISDFGFAKSEIRNPKSEIKRYLLEDGLRDEKIMAIVEDDAARIWISTAGHGISCLETSGVFRHFGKKDGLITNDFLLSSGYKDNLGRLYFGGEEGLQIFHPDSLPASQRPAAPLYFTDFRAAGRSGENLQLLVLDSSIHFVKNVVVPPGYANLAFRFAALDFFQPENIRYAYRLGREEEWQDLGFSREISLLQLPPRTYLLQIKAVHNESFSEGKTASLRLVVQPAWYQRLLAKIIALLLLAGAGIWLYKFRVRRKLAAAETRRLRELDAVKTRLYTNITHEFRTPLTLILGEAEQLKKGSEQPFRKFETFGKVAVTVADSIRRHGQQLLNLVNQMLDLAKLESGKLHLKMAQGDVVAFLKYLLESFQSVADAKKIALRFDSPVEHFIMDYDEERLRQIVSNLLSNAIKFTPEGGEVALRANHGDFQNHHDLKYLRLTISDTGAGIPPEKLPRIFDRFYQVDDSATRQGEGTGIGLTLTKELVKLLGGTIQVESEAAKGTTFMVSLPVSRNAPATSTPPDPLKGEPNLQNPANNLLETTSDSSHFGSPFRGSGGVSVAGAGHPLLLVVEDNADVLRYVSGILKKTYRLETATNGKSGLEKALVLVPDLILSDVMMPEMDGYELCRRLKNDLRTSHVPVVLLTARADFEGRLEGLETGAEAYLAKPFEQRELEIVLRKLLENRRILQERYRSPEFWSNMPQTPPAPKGEPATATLEPSQTISNNLKPAPPAAVLEADSFLRKLKSLVEADLTRQWRVPDLATQMHVGETQLHRKLEALIGMHTTEFVRYVRLLNAARLLREQPEMKVSAISYEVGFGAPNEFSNRFKEVFGCSPKEWRERADGAAKAG